MSLININGSIEIINDQCSQDSITNLIRQYMGDDMAEYVEQALKNQSEENEELLDTLKSAYKDLKLVIKRADVCNKEDTMDDISDIYQTLEENLYYYGIS